MGNLCSKKHSVNVITNNKRRFSLNEDEYTTNNNIKITGRVASKKLSNASNNNFNLSINNNNINNNNNTKNIFIKNSSCSVNDYIKGNLIGKGSLASVYSGLSKTTGEIVALKVISLKEIYKCNKLLDKPYFIENKLCELAQALIKLQSLSHANLIKYTFTDDSFDISNLEVSLIYEFCNGASISTLQSKFGNFEEKTVKKYVKQILLCLDYLDLNNVEHNSLKLSNILIDGDGTVRLIDTLIDSILLGLFFAQSSDLDIFNNYDYIPYWLAPESISFNNINKKITYNDFAKNNTIKNNNANNSSISNSLKTNVNIYKSLTNLHEKINYSNNNYLHCSKSNYSLSRSTSSDIWSLGCLIVEMLKKNSLYSEYNFKNNKQFVNYLKDIKEPPAIPDTFSKSCIDFIKQCLVIDPKKRSSIDKLLNHEFLNTDVLLLNNNVKSDVINDNINNRKCTNLFNNNNNNSYTVDNFVSSFKELVVSEEKNNIDVNTNINNEIINNNNNTQDINNKTEYQNKDDNYTNNKQNKNSNDNSSCIEDEYDIYELNSEIENSYMLLNRDNSVVKNSFNIDTLHKSLDNSKSIIILGKHDKFNNYNLNDFLKTAKYNNNKVYSSNRIVNSTVENKVNSNKNLIEIDYKNNLDNKIDDKNIESYKKQSNNNLININNINSISEIINESAINNIKELNNLSLNQQLKLNNNDLKTETLLNKTELNNNNSNSNVNIITDKNIAANSNTLLINQSIQKSLKEIIPLNSTTNKDTNKSNIATINKIDDSSLDTIKDFIKKNRLLFNKVENANELAISNLEDVQSCLNAKSNSRIMLIKKKATKNERPLDIEYIRRKIQTNKIFFKINK